MGLKTDELISTEEAMYLNLFCTKYGFELVDIQPNTERSPPQGFMYYFDKGFGGYSIDGIKKSLKQR